VTKICAFLLFTTAFFVTPSAGSADTSTLRCEEWHPRLGQNPDKVFAIDLSSKTCNGQPCMISDEDFKWQEQGGRYDVAINRKSGEGKVVLQGELLFSYKSCTLVSGKP
jgi:hypothetical protein